MNTEDEPEVMDPEARTAPPSIAEIADDAPPADDSEDASQRGGSIDIVSATDLVDEASQESFPASDPPAWMP